MILSVSRRTDIPNYFSDWFFKRIEDNYLCVRNPMNTHQISKIKISPEVVDCIVFWTKNPKPMLDKLHLLNNYNYYFQFTLTGYGHDIEPGLPNKKDELIPTFIELSKRVGKERVVWRYDPILVNERYTLEYHKKAFNEMATMLDKYTQKVVISFIDFYDKTLRNTKELNIQILDNKKIIKIAVEFAKIATRHGLVIESCAETIDLKACGIKHGKCIDDVFIEKLIETKLNINKDKTQRAECGCVESIDIGAYNTCMSRCKYCYANVNDNLVQKNIMLHNENASLLYGEILDNDRVNERKVKSLRNEQFDLFDLL